MSNSVAFDLLGAAGATVTGNDIIWPGGDGSVFVDSAGFNGATVALQTKTPAGNYVNVGTNVSFTAAGVGSFVLPSCILRMAISVAVPSQPVFARCVRVNP